MSSGSVQEAVALVPRKVVYTVFAQPQQKFSLSLSGGSMPAGSDKALEHGFWLIKRSLHYRVITVLMVDLAQLPSSRCDFSLQGKKKFPSLFSFFLLLPKQNTMQSVDRVISH